MSTPRCLAVMYHYVRDRSGAESGVRGLDAETFGAQLDLLCEVMTPIDWPAMVAWRKAHGAIPDSAFLLTFDDGLSDHAQVVLPILQERGLRGVFFVQTGVLTDGCMHAAHQTHLLLSKLGVDGLTDAVNRWLDAHAPHLQEERRIDPNRARMIYHYEEPAPAELKYLLTRSLPMDVGDALLDDLFAATVGDSRAHAARWYLQWDDLSRMQSAGHTIGAHGHRHDPYDRLSVSEQAADMARCASILREGLGPAPRPFSYPYGACDEDIARRCAFAGFVNGFTTQQGWITTSDDAHRLCRVDTIHVDAFMEKEFACTLH